jgi:hypothetical protein
MPGHATSYEITKKIRVQQDRKGFRCDPNNNQKVIKCLQDYFDKNLDCALPWRTNLQGKNFRCCILSFYLSLPNLGKRVCDQMSDIMSLNNVTWNVTQGSRKISKVLEISGCARNCKMIQYFIKTLGSTR